MVNMFFGVKLPSIHPWLNATTLKQTRRGSRTIKYLNAKSEGCSTREKKVISLRKCIITHIFLKKHFACRYSIPNLCQKICCWPIIPHLRKTRKSWNFIHILCDIKNIFRLELVNNPTVDTNKNNSRENCLRILSNRSKTVFWPTFWTFTTI